ncbi:MAG: nuclear transport factor 2 family protein [Burkholderiaceae bacterium]|nr:nuclear transport factor 2 family protein [Burkholderiaceae bacterium]
MKLKNLMLGAILSTMVALCAAADVKTDVDAIKQVITDAYFNGAYNDLNTVNMAKGFHPDFAILGADGDKLERFTIKEWIASIEKRKAQANFDIKKSKREGKIIQVDATAGVASAKLEIYKEGSIQYTDYLSLVQFPSGWKIVSKVYAEHAK